jgi:hypothetical protein
VKLLDNVKRRFSRPPEPVRSAVRASADPHERVLAWGSLVRDEGWLVATSQGLRIVPLQLPSVVDAVALDSCADVKVLPWHETADGGGRFEVVPLTEIEPGVQARRAEIRHVLSDAGELPGVVRRRVDETVVASQRSPLPGGGGVLLVARRIPGRPGREWTVVFDDDAQRSDPDAREAARRKLADLVAADQPD